ncbi:MAG: heavy metal-binding domain-containing protein [Alloprevotella sp.]|nr:heavy metal-binding domain-containing protein [Alloprevotella sp.]
MIITTTPNIEGFPVKQYLGIVNSETIIGANILKDVMANLRDFFGGRNNTYEKSFRTAVETALKELEQQALARGANAVVGVKVDYEVVGASGSMLMATCVGTAVLI